MILKFGRLGPKDMHWRCTLRQEVFTGRDLYKHGNNECRCQKPYLGGSAT